jgi:hypothetical protein
LETFFKFLQPGELNQWSGDFKAICLDRSELEEAVRGALELAHSAAYFFRGAYPVESPSFVWGKTLDLPWFPEYWKSINGGDTLSSQPIGEEVESIAQRLTEVAKNQSYTTPWRQATYSADDLTGSAKLKMQGLAVEAMLAAEGFLSRVSQRQYIESMPWLLSANANIIECTCQAQEILGFASEKARASAMVRHRENHAMKAQTLAWCDDNIGKFDSLDAAAMFVSTKLVPIGFRAARSWIGEWKKLRSASTK